MIEDYFTKWEKAFGVHGIEAEFQWKGNESILIRVADLSLSFFSLCANCWVLTKHILPPPILRATASWSGTIGLLNVFRAS